MTETTISNIEVGRYRSISPITLSKLDKAFRQRGDLISFYFHSLRQGAQAKTRITRKATVTMAKIKIDLPESNSEDDTLERLQWTMPKATATYATIQSKSIVSNLARIQKSHGLSNAEFAESIGISKRVWSLAKRGGTALGREKVERIVELFPEVVPISFDENAKRRFGKIVKKMRKQTGLTQRELAENSGVSSALISKVERGKNVDLSLRTIKKLDKELKANGELEQHALRLLSKGKRPCQTP